MLKKISVSPKYNHWCTELVSSGSHRTIKREISDKMSDLLKILAQCASVPEAALCKLDVHKIDTELKLFDAYLEIARQQEQACSNASHTAASNCLAKAYEGYLSM